MSCNCGHCSSTSTAACRRSSTAASRMSCSNGRCSSSSTAKWWESLTCCWNSRIPEEDLNPEAGSTSFINASSESYNSIKKVRLWETEARKWGRQQTWRRSLSSPHNAALSQSMTSENGRTQSLLRRTGMQADCKDSRNLKFVTYTKLKIPVTTEP